MRRIYTSMMAIGDVASVLYFVACSIRVFLRNVFLTSYEYCVKKLLW